MVWFIMRLRRILLERGTLKKMYTEKRRTHTARSGRVILVAIAALGPAGASEPGEAHWLDVESRIQYGYFTEDLRGLRNLAQQVATDESQDALKSYYVGLLAYRLTLLSEAQGAKPPTGEAQAPPKPADKTDPGKNEARQTVERCVSSLDHALKARNDFADALALQSACLGRLAELSSWRTPFAGPKSATQLRKALQLAPKNPRVLLLDAIGDYEHSKAPEGAPRPCEKFKSTAAVFDAERADVDQVPGWGAAEAYMWLGRCYLGNGDVVPARDALERALLIAPEFAQARRLLSSITSG
jgi:tetratricopeptide (TPR) repeat protein